jgi:2,4-dienoyl-CoA reductase (NADPH2)
VASLKCVYAQVVAYADVLSGKVTVGKTVAVVGAGGIGFDVSEFLTHTPLTGSSGAAHATSGSVSSGAPEGQSVAEFMNTWGVDMTSAKRGGITGPKDFEQPMASEREVFLLQRSKGKPGAGLGKTTGWIHKLTLKKSGVHMWGGVKEYLKVDDAGLHIRLSKPKKGDWPRPLQPELGETEASDGSTRDMVLPVDHVVVCAGQEPLKALQPCLQAAHIPHFLIGGAEAAAELDAKRAMDQGTRLAAALEDAESGAVFNQPVKWEAGVVKQVFKWMGR